MYILAFFLIVSISQWITNKILNISDDNTVGYSYSKRDSLIILGFLAFGVLFQFIKLKNKAFWLVLAIYSLGMLLTMIILATIKKIIIENQRKDLQQVFDVLTPVLPKNAEIDYNNPPFKLGYEKHQINRIAIEINPNTFKETVATNLCLSLNKYLPNYEWVSEMHFEDRECVFVGTPLPPAVAKYKGSWLRPAEFIPIGLSGLGEVSWNINSFKNAGRSTYIYDDGKLAKTVDTPSAPQALIVGSPLGLDTIIPTTKGYKTIETIEVGDEVFDINNKPVRVLGKSEVFTDHNVYQLRFVSDNKNIIDIVADSIHKFPVESKIQEEISDIEKITYNWQEKSVEELNIFNDRIIGIDPRMSEFKKSYMLTIKQQIKSLPVQCILVDSDSHLFLITDEKNANWVGGQSYPYKAIYTRNTGGGKSLYINQEVEVISKDEM